MRTITIFAALVALSAAPLAAQASEGFLFKRPAISLGLRGGFGHANAGSDLFSFTTERLTLDRGDFSGPLLGLEIAGWVTPRVELAFNVASVEARADSEFRDFVEDNDQPIEQTTTFRRIPLTATARWYVTPRGTSIGRWAWIPARFTPYVGVGGGGVHYRFVQEGDFVDEETLDIFTETLISEGWAPTVHGAVGAQYSLSPTWAIDTELRYGWAEADLRDSFAGFEPLDLSGFSATVGISLRI